MAVYADIIWRRSIAQENWKAILAKHPIQNKLPDPRDAGIDPSVRSFKGSDHMLNNKSIGATACLAPHLPERYCISDYYTRRRKMQLLADHLLGQSGREAHKSETRRNGAKRRGATAEPRNRDGRRTRHVDRNGISQTRPHEGAMRSSSVPAGTTSQPEGVA